MSQQIKCKRCGHEWNYGGTAKRISCSHCKTTITLNKAQVPQPVQIPTATQVPKPEPLQTARKHEEALLPIPLADQLNKFLLARLIGIARGEGAKTIRFKINNEGELYVPQS